MPSPETLKQAARALHCVQEFLIEPLEHALKRISADAGFPDDKRTYPIPEDERAISYADIGRLIGWTDELRKDVGYLLDPLVNIALLAHEDLEAIASGLHGRQCARGQVVERADASLPWPRRTLRGVAAVTTMRGGRWRLAPPRISHNSLTLGFL